VHAFSDFKDAQSVDPTVRRELADRIRDACVNVGFFYRELIIPLLSFSRLVYLTRLQPVNNIDDYISESTTDGAVGAAKDFFALPDEEKLYVRLRTVPYHLRVLHCHLLSQIDIHKSENFKGYTALLGENANPENRGDLHEAFDIGWEDPPNDHHSSVRTNGAMSGTNVWPAPLATSLFKNQVLDYYYAAVALGKALFPLFALALDLPEHYFADKTKENAAIMRLLHYPPQTGVVDERVQGIGAHTDYECFTILWQDSVQALQVLNTQGKWIDAVPIPGTVVVK
jgi:isopenicillin N synthase-like dioxygenase